ncbi:MAG: flagellar motor switch protein FliN [Pseudomonadota bacterium]
MSALSPALHRFGDVSVRLSVELGRTDMPLRDVLALGEGSVVPLNRLTDELLDVTANGKVIARGEVIAEGGKFALRIVSLAGDEPEADFATSSAPASTAQDAQAPAAMAQNVPDFGPTEVADTQTPAAPPVDEAQP